MTRVAIATTSALAAEAAAEIADAGGNAVDCAAAAALLTMNTEPGVCALAGSAFVTIWPADGEPVTIDGNVAIPGSGSPAFDPAHGIEDVQMEYGGGITTLIGGASVAVPGSLAALDKAVSAYGSLPLREIMQPTIRAAQDGFPLSSACHHYLEYSGSVIFGKSDDGFRALHEEDGTLKTAGSRISVPGLADSLELIAREGASVFYEGELGHAIADHVQAKGGLLTREDLQSYRAIARPALTCSLGDLRVATNPPPAVGGAVLLSMLIAFGNKSFAGWSDEAVQHLIDVQLASLNYRTRVLDLGDNVQHDAQQLLEQARSGVLVSRYASGSTVHTSAVDDSGAACAITASSGYGSGEMPAGTGLWLNNCLGELELNRHGFDAGPVGARLPSNMAPTVARGHGQVLAAGSPGADRITTALQQFFINFTTMNMSLRDAVDYPRLHAEVRGPLPIIAFEPGISVPDKSLKTKPYPDKGMYFGGVGVAMFERESGFQVAADPRRAGGTFISPE